MQIPLASDFQRRAVFEDLSKKHLPWIIDNKPKAIIFDLVSERYDLLKIGDCFATFSKEIHDSGLLTSGMIRHVKISRFSEEAWAAWKCGLTRFAEQRSLHFPETSIVVINSKWAGTYRENGALYPFLDQWTYHNGDPRSILEHNVLLDRCRTDVATAIPDVVFLNVPESLIVGDARHTWGKEPVHYVPEFYMNLHQQLRQLFPRCFSTAAGSDCEPTARYRLLNSDLPTQDGSTAGESADRTKPSVSKAMLGRCGWIFLNNDSNNFIGTLTGEVRWSDDERRSALLTMCQRKGWLAERGASYLRLIVPEKSVVYREYLAAPLDDIRAPSGRPAQIMQAEFPGICFYPEEELRARRAIQHTYFRGDSHTNWFGAFVIYRVIVDALTAAGLVNHASVLTLSDLVPSVAAYNGDLVDHLSQCDRAAFMQENFDTTTKFGIETLLQYKIRPTRSRAQAAELPPEYTSLFGPRAQYRTVVSDESLPKAVIFRDSTADFVWPLLAEHFREATFIWQGGHVFREVIERERPDVVIHMQAERFLASDPITRPTYSVETLVGIRGGGSGAG
jgi:hypothetical protein